MRDKFRKLLTPCFRNNFYTLSVRQLDWLLEQNNFEEDFRKTQVYKRMRELRTDERIFMKNDKNEYVYSELRDYLEIYEL